LEAAAFDEPRSVKTSALPLDLLARLRGPSTKRRHPKSPRAWLRSPFWIVALVIASALAVLAILDSPYDRGFAMPARAIVLAIALFLATAWLARRGVSGFLSDSGEHLVLGDTSLVIVSARHVRIFPAEHLSTTGGLFYKEELLDYATYPQEFAHRLAETIARAKEDPAARAADRFRIAALKYEEPIPSNAVEVGKRLAPVVLFALGITTFVEAQPLHTRATKNVDARRADWDRIERGLVSVADRESTSMPGIYEIAKRNEEAAQAKHDAEVLAAQKAADEAAAAKVARDKETFTTLLAPAKKGMDEEAMRALLRFAKEECSGCDSSQVELIEAKLVKHCNERVGEEFSTASLNAVRAIALHACLSLVEKPYELSGSCTEETADVCKSRIDDVKDFAGLVEPKSPMPIIANPLAPHRFAIQVITRTKHVGEVPADKFQPGEPEDVTYQLIVYSTPLIEEEKFTISTIWFLTTTYGGGLY
jgi:hypothetical protein